MRRFLPVGRLVGTVLVVVIIGGGRGASQSPSRAVTVAPTTLTAVRDWDNSVNRMLRTNELQVRLSRADALIPGRTIEQLDQYYKGVRVWGGSVSRQLDGGGAAISVFGALYSDIVVGVVPTLAREDAKAAIERIGGATLGADRLPELIILPTDGGYRLAWMGEIANIADSLRVFLDAHSGVVVQTYSIREHQGPTVTVGRGTGVLGDAKKVSAMPFAGRFITTDPLRPPTLNTYGMRGDLLRVLAFLNGQLALSVDDIASDSDNDWTDTPVVDAHVYAGYTYDYYFKRFGRRGLDNADVRILNIVHPVNREDISILPPEAADFHQCVLLRRGRDGLRRRVAV